MIPVTFGPGKPRKPVSLVQVRALVLAGDWLALETISGGALPEDLSALRSLLSEIPPGLDKRALEIIQVALIKLIASIDVEETNRVLLALLNSPGAVLPSLDRRVAMGITWRRFPEALPWLESVAFGTDTSRIGWSSEILMHLDLPKYYSLLLDSLARTSDPEAIAERLIAISSHVYHLPEKDSSALLLCVQHYWLSSDSAQVRKEAMDLLAAACKREVEPEGLSDWIVERCREGIQTGQPRYSAAEISRFYTLASRLTENSR